MYMRERFHADFPPALTGKGLFGKNKGVYWWHSQVRGEPSKGVVVKDYKQKH